MAYPHNEIDSKWQKKWEEAQCFKTNDNSKKPKFYALDMFPYPSGAGLHMGHVASFTPTDIVARYKRVNGFEVLHPMGYDAFGLPAEQYAIQTGVHPAITTQKAIDNFRNQLKAYGYSFDWSREVSTADPGFYKWTQFIFIKLFEKGLAYQKEVPVNWCPALRTVLANEEIIDGKSERGGHPVIRMPMKQWMLKITDYAERLLTDLDKIDWPERSKEGQRQWIGKSEGARVKFQVEGGTPLEVFTTRPDTLFGVTFMVLAPEHPLVKDIAPAPHKAEVQKYVDKSASKSEVERKAATEKTGVFTGAHAVNPVNGAKVPIWIADYVLMDYGTGAIMAVPGHDLRDHEFATKFNLPVIQVLKGDQPIPFEGDGEIINSGFLNGFSKAAGIKKMIEHLESKGFGERQVQYKLRDWLFSRQRYWGEPFPMVQMKDGSMVPIGVDELPVTLPEVANYEPSEQGEPPLARSKEFVEYTNPKTGEKGIRVTDTMPGSAGSSWYFLRYIDPHNTKEAFSFEKQKHWMPVDLYIGGPEHTVGHLLYARFWQKVLFDCGLVSHDEPFKKLAHQGTIMGPDGTRMSKSKGNVVSVDEVRKEYGADAVRMYMCFLGPFDKDKPWATTGIEGVHRFLDKIWRLSLNEDGSCGADDSKPLPEKLQRLLHKTIKKVGEDYEALSFNTAVSAMMILMNEVASSGLRPKAALRTVCQIMAPIAPHMAEELWSKLGGEGFVCLASWPTYDTDLVKDATVTMAVQVNGKTRGTIELAVDAPEQAAIDTAKGVNAVKNALDGKTIVKVIYKPTKILNIIIK